MSRGNIYEKQPKVGIGMMILKEEKVLLGKRHSDPEKADSALHGEGTWTMPGGGLHFGEKPEDCARRETLEETGIKVDKEKLKLISVSNDVIADAHYITLGFLCEDFEGEAKVMEPDEIVEWRWFELTDLPTPIYFPSERVLKNYLAGTIYQEEH